VDLDRFTPPALGREAAVRSAARRGLGLPERGYVAAFVGRIQPLKGPDVVLRAAARLLDAGAEFTAIFAQSDLLAIGAMRELRARGFAVPGDVSVVGFDDLSMAQWETFRLTTVHQPLAEMARAAVDLLTERLREPERSVRKLVFPSKLVVRDTTGPPITHRTRETAPAYSGREPAAR
jgi:DNA-binding LacI/PurR family transcriptional regulator